MNDCTHNQDHDAELQSSLISQIPPPQLEPQTAERDRAEEENNNTLPGSRGNTTVCKTSFGTPRVTVCDLISLIWPLLSHACDLGTDIYLAVEYFTGQENLYFWLTLAFKIFPAITCSYISSLMRQENFPGAQAEEQDGGILQKILQLMLNFVMDILFQLTLSLRELHILRDAWKVRQCKKKEDTDGLDRYYPKMLKEQADRALLDVIESFLKSAPKLVVQLTILLMKDRKMTTTMWVQIVGGCIRLVSLGLCMRNYHLTIRLAQPNKDVITIKGSILLFIWHFGTITARIFLISIAASHWPLHILLACIPIWVGWIAYLCNMDGVFIFCRKKTVPPLLPRTLPENIRTFFFAAVLAVIFRFTFVNLKEGPTRTRYTIYHVLCGVENSMLLTFTLWFKFASLFHGDVWFSGVLLILSVIFYLVGIAAFVLYYNLRPHTHEDRFVMSGAAAHSLPSIVCQQV